jgi:hypothetical protein
MPSRKRKGGPRPNTVYRAPRKKALEIRLSFKHFETLKQIARIAGITPKTYVELLVKQRFEPHLYE